MRFSEILSESEKQRLDPKCWKGYKKQGTKIKGGVRVNNCVPKEGIEEDNGWREASAKSNLQPGVPIMVWLGPRNQNPPRDDKKYWEKGEVMDSPEWIDGAWRVLIKTPSKGQWPINPERVFVLKSGIGEDFGTMAGAAALGSLAAGAIGAGMGHWLKKDREKERAKMAKITDPKKKGVKEEYNAEYDDEAGMADNNLETLKRAVQGIDDLIHPGDNLPEWCQEKIAVAESMLVSVWDYMKSEQERGAVDEDWQKVNRKDKTSGMSKKAVAAYRREHPGSKLQTAVTTKPSKLKKGSKASKRRKSFCARSLGQKKMHNIDCTKTPDKAICKARKRWNCE